jgi:ATP-dependent RNA helicase DDX35
MIDEAHGTMTYSYNIIERTIYTELVLGLLKKILSKRPDLRVIISSATLDAQSFLEYFNETDKENATILSISGKQFPGSFVLLLTLVHVQYLQAPTSNYIEQSAETILMIHKFEDPGDILLFLPDQQAVELVTSVINNNRDKTLYAIPLYTGLSMNEQLKAIDRPPHGHRKVVVATSIAEASVTIEGILFGIFVTVILISKLLILEPMS